MIIKNLKSFSNSLTIRETPNKTTGCRLDSILQIDYRQCQQNHRAVLTLAESLGVQNGTIFGER